GKQTADDDHQCDDDDEFDQHGKTPRLVSNDYAAHMSYLQFRLADYRFRPSLAGTILMLCCIPLFIKFGFWQYHKAERERALQALFDQAQNTAPVALPADFPDAASLDRWRYRHVKVTGSYLPQYQLLLDN